MNYLVLISFCYMLMSNVSSDNATYCGIFAQFCLPGECVFLRYLFPSATGPIKKGENCGLFTCPCEDGLICEVGTCVVNGKASNTSTANVTTSKAP